MNLGRTAFSQIMDALPAADFHRLVDTYSGNYRMRTLSCRDHFFVMAFAQLSFRESLRDIESCLRAAPTKPYQLGIRTRVSRSTLADANEKRDWRIYEGLAQILLHRAQRVYAGQAYYKHFRRAVYAFDSTTIELSLKLFPWSYYKKDSGGVKLHTQLNVSSHIPSFLRVTRARIHDVNLVDDLSIEPGAVYVFDRGYVDFERLHRIAKAGAFFVIRARKNARFRRTQSHPTDGLAGVVSDHSVRLSSFYTVQAYPDTLRRIRYTSPENGKRFIFVTNHFGWSPLTVADMYKARWSVELFFKWIKQHLRIKAFYGTTENAVKTQLWIALSVYLMLALIKKDLDLPHSLHSMSQVLSLHLFEKIPLQELFARTHCKKQDYPSSNPRLLFDF
jgi:hypothetical protein